MYKLLLFLKKPDKDKTEEMIDLFMNQTLKHISEVTGNEIAAGNVESNLLMEIKYIKFCEVSVSSKDEWDRKMSSRAGKELNKHLMNMHQFVDLIFINYPDK